MTITKDAEYTTRSGLPVRIYATDAGGEWPVHGAILGGTKWESVCWTSCGKLSTRGEIVSTNDLIPKPRTMKVYCWLNVYPDGSVYSYMARNHADQISNSRIACIHIVREVTEGEGL